MIDEMTIIIKQGDTYTALKVKDAHVDYLNAKTDYETSYMLAGSRMLHSPEQMCELKLKFAATSNNGDPAMLATSPTKNKEDLRWIFEEG